MVEQRDAETFENWAESTPGHLVDHSLYQTPILTKTWFHTGAVTDRDAILAQFRGEYWDREMARQGFALPANEPALPDARLLLGASVDPNALTPVLAEDWRRAPRPPTGIERRNEVSRLDTPPTPPPLAPF